MRYFWSSLFCFCLFDLLSVNRTNGQIKNVSVERKGPDETLRMRKVIWVRAVCACSNARFRLTMPKYYLQLWKEAKKPARRNLKTTGRKKRMNREKSVAITVLLMIGTYKSEMIRVKMFMHSYYCTYNDMCVQIRDVSSKNVNPDLLPYFYWLVRNIRDISGENDNEQLLLYC